MVISQAPKRGAMILVQQETKGYEFGIAGWWDSVPVIGRLTRQDDPGNSGLSQSHAERVHMLEKLWTENGGENKRDFLFHQPDRFHCGYDISEKEGLHKAARERYIANHGKLVCQKIWLDGT